MGKFPLPAGRNFPVFSRAQQISLAPKRLSEGTGRNKAMRLFLPREKKSVAKNNVLELNLSPCRCCFHFAPPVDSTCIVFCRRAQWTLVTMQSD